jgi:hypothetical protein
LNFDKANLPEHPCCSYVSFFFVVFFICLCSVSCSECCQCIRGLSIRDFPVCFLFPSLYQCAEVCLSLKLCKSLNFDKANKKCHISINTWNINVLTANKDFLYAEKDDIPQVSRTDYENSAMHGS